LKDAPSITPATNINSAKKDFSVKEMLKTREAYFLFFIFFSACMSGLYLIGIVKDIGVQFVGLTPVVAANSVAMVAIFNTAGRIILGALSDKLGRLNVIIFTLSITTISVFTLSFIHLNFAIFFVCVASIAFCFGGNITVFPTIVVDFFGSKNQTKNYGIIYQGFGLGALSGSFIETLSGGFKPTFIIIGGLCLISIILISIMKTTKLNIPTRLTPTLAKKIA
jgi:OFA family oxalate/formate antiporter-like MFS transporter